MIAYEIYCNNNKIYKIYINIKSEKGRRLCVVLKKKQETQCDKMNTMNDKENSFYRRETDQWTGS